MGKDEDQQEQFQVEIVNDVALILRVQGKEFGSAEIFDSVATDISQVNHSIGRKFNQRIATLAGRHAAKVMKQFASSKMNIRQDNLLVFAWTAFNQEIKTKTDADLLSTISAPPMETDTLKDQIGKLYKSATERITKTDRAA